MFLFIGWFYSNIKISTSIKK